MSTLISCRNGSHRSRWRAFLIPLAAILACTLGITAPALAQRNYAVEVVVFAHEHEDLEAGELWIRTWRPQLRGDASVREPDYLPLGRLNGPMQALERTPGYRVLSHVVWSQPLLPRGQAPLVALSPTVGAGGASTFLEPEVTGYARMHGTQQLQLEIDVVYRPVERGGRGSGLDVGYAGVDEGFRAAVGDPYFLQNRRRVRLNEVHYFDHPRFGVLAVVYAREP